eukprot:Opistho-1_new@88456
MLLQAGDNHVLRVVAGILGEHLRDDKDSVGIRLHAQPRTALDLILVLHEIPVESDLKGAGARDHGAVLDRVLHRPQAVVHGILDLGERVRVGPLDEDRDRLGVLDVLHKRELLLAERVLVDEAGVAEAIRREVIHRVHGRTAACEDETLHVAPLGTAEAHDALLREHVQRDGVNALLVDDDKALLGALAHAPLELDDLAHALVRKGALGDDHLVALLGALVEEARVDLALLVLERNVARENVGVLDALLHVGVARTVVEHEALDELRVDVQLVPHLHNLDHVEVDRLPSRRIVRTASTTQSVSTSASSRCTFVRSDVRAMLARSSRSMGTFCFTLSRTSRARFLAMSKPSLITRGWRPSEMYRSACLRSSPIMRTFDVVPSPVISSCAVDARAMSEAVGCWICISWRRTLPSFVILMSREPETSIFMVPFGPRFVLRISWRPCAADMFTCNAAAWRATSAFGLRS